MKKAILLISSHLIIGIIGFSLGVYLLPVLIAPSAPTAEHIASLTNKPGYVTHFKRDLPGSDFLHWGEGNVYVRPDMVLLSGKLAPGPDYKLYLSPVYIETEDDFLLQRQHMVKIGDVKTFDNFIVPVPAGVDIKAYTTVIVWCETFGQFITSARYQSPNI